MKLTKMQKQLIIRIQLDEASSDLEYEGLLNKLIKAKTHFEFWQVIQDNLITLLEFSKVIHEDMLPHLVFDNEKIERLYLQYVSRLKQRKRSNAQENLLIRLQLAITGIDDYFANAYEELTYKIDAIDFWQVVNADLPFFFAGNLVREDMLPYIILDTEELKELYKIHVRSLK
jgi:hypothetical protein